MHLEGDMAYIEFQDNRPFQILTMEIIQGIHGPYTRHEDYNIDWSKKYGVYCIENVGSGPTSCIKPHDCIFWADSTCEVEPEGTCTRLDTLPDLSFLEDAWECDAIYCSLCDDHFPDEVYAPCPHVRWCNECGCWSTPQGDEECSHRSADNSTYVDPDDEEDNDTEERNTPPSTH